ncbi:MAG: hypothetical protein HQL73_12915, partial [Magnetococcales bacterium]|nr:hypothetical protein [Magnetococcales bacterium]
MDQPGGSASEVGQWNFAGGGDHRPGTETHRSVASVFAQDQRNLSVSGRTKAIPGAGRARTPTILQMEAVECGAATLATVLAYYGRWVSLEELRQACGVTRDGSKASNILKAARSYGLSAKAFKKNDPKALISLPVPSIIHWNFNHFLVFEGILKGTVHLNDPASGPRTVSLEELGEGFTGVVLALEPGPEFQRLGRSPSLWRALAGHLQNSLEAVGFVMLASLLLVIPSVLVPVFFKVFVDDI